MSRLAAPAPVISSVILTGSGQNLQAIVTGHDFGPAPAGIPGDGDIPYFQFHVWVPGSQSIDYPWEAGSNGRLDGGETNVVTLKYVSWSDTQIRFSGFGQDYGAYGWTAASGDAAAALLYAAHGGVAGPGVAKAFRLP